MTCKDYPANFDLRVKTHVFSCVHFNILIAFVAYVLIPGLIKTERKVEKFTFVNSEEKYFSRCGLVSDKVIFVLGLNFLQVF